jgi:hypothetical protein
MEITSQELLVLGLRVNVKHRRVDTMLTLSLLSSSSYLPGKINNLRQAVTTNIGFNPQHLSVEISLKLARECGVSQIH